MKAAVIARLKAHAPLMVLVAQNAVAWGLVGQSVPVPYVTLQEISASPTYGLKSKSDHVPVRVQIDCWADTQSKAEAIGATVRGALEMQVFGPVMAAFVADTNTSFETEGPERVWRRRLDFIIHIKE